MRFFYNSIVSDSLLNFFLKNIIIELSCRLSPGIIGPNMPNNRHDTISPGPAWCYCDRFMSGRILPGLRQPSPQTEWAHK